MLSLFSRRKSAEKVAEHPRPNNPDLHLLRTANRAMDKLEFTGDDYDDIEHRPAPSRAVRAWRLGAGATVNGAQPDGQIALSTEQGHRAASHLDHGAPDARRTNLAPSGNESAPEAPYQPGRELRHNDRETVQLNPAAPPSRPRAGFTGADPTRAARFQVAFLLRPFDQGIAQHPGTVERADQPAPTAARPPERKRLVGGRASATGREGTGMTPIGGHRNTVRQTPGAWDEKLVNTGNGAPASAARAAGWRAR